MSQFEDVFKAISHRSRREILSYLLKEGKPVSSGDINQRFSFSWPTLCKHLKSLNEARLIKKKKIGREIYYSLNKQRLIGVVKTWLNSFE